MIIFTYILTVISSLILGAHFLREANYGVMAAIIFFPYLLLIKKRWVLYIFSGLLFLAALIWLKAAFDIYEIRMAMNMPYTRMIIIMTCVSAFTIINGLMLQNKKMKSKYLASENDQAICWTFFITFFLIGFSFWKVDFPIVLLERFLPGFGWVAVFALAVYAAFISEKILNPALTSIWRRRIWLMFSVVFFGQFILGLVGYEIFLMTGELHLPVPALILAGPLFRWELTFMVFLFLSSMFMIGPAWCSYLCYFGVWDDIASRRKKKPKQLAKKKQIVRVWIFVSVILIALVLNIAGVSTFTAIVAGIIFGLAGIWLMISRSRKKGVMTHCVEYCPIGLLAITIGKISPFRMAINNSCDECSICHLACRYDALNIEDIKKRKPNNNCTYCGDCISVCPNTSIEYKFFKLKPETARKLFIVIVVSVHAAFLGLGRI